MTAHLSFTLDIKSGCLQLSAIGIKGLCILLMLDCDIFKALSQLGVAQRISLVLSEEILLFEGE